MHLYHPSHFVRRRHKSIDMLHGPLLPRILLFALPLAATAILQQLFNAADIAVVGRFVGEGAMAAVGSSGPLISLMVNLFIGISLGTNVVISQYTGADNTEGIRKAVHTSLIVAVLGGICISVLGELFSVRILHLLSVPDEVLGMAETYLRIYLLGIPIIFLYNFEAAIFRSQGDTQTPLIVLTLSGVINVLLNLFLVCVAHMTVEGVAIATVTANLFSAAILMILLLRHDGAIRLDPKELRIDGRVLRRILQIGVPSGIQSMVYSLSNVCLQSAINSLGTTVMAGSAAAANLEFFVYFVLNSFGQACTTFVGQNYGAHLFDRCRRVFRLCLGLDFLFTAMAAGIVLTFIRPLLALFNGNPDILVVGSTRLQVLFFAYIFSVQVEICSGYMRAFGYSLIPALVSMVTVCGIRILWVFAVFPHYRTFFHVMLAYPVSLAVNAALLVASALLVAKRVYAEGTA